MIRDAIDWTCWGVSCARDAAVWGLILGQILICGCSGMADWCDHQLAPEQFGECRAEDRKHPGDCCWSDKVTPGKTGRWTRWAPCRDHPADEPCPKGTGFDF